MVQEKLAEYVSSRGVKQKAIAESCGMTEMAVSSSMRGERKLTADEFYSICRFLGISLDFFRCQ